MKQYCAALLLPLVMLFASLGSAGTVDLQFHGTIDTVLHPELLDGSGIGVGALFGGDVSVLSDGASLYPADLLYPGSSAFVLQAPGTPFLVAVDAGVGTPQGDPPDLPFYASTYDLLFVGPNPAGGLFNDPGDWIWSPGNYPLNAHPSADRFAVSLGFIDKDSTRSLSDDVAQAITSFDSWDAAYFFVLYNGDYSAPDAPTDTFVLAYGRLQAGPLMIPAVPEPDAAALAGAALALVVIRSRVS